MEGTNNYPNLKQSLVLLLLLILVQLAVSLILVLIGSLLSRATGLEAAQETTSITAIGSVISFGLIVLWGLKKTGQRFYEVFRLVTFKIALLAPLVLLMLGLGILLSQADNVMRYFLPMPQFLVEIFEKLFDKGLISLLLLAIVAPLTEEFLFRGLILRGFLKNYQTRKAVLLSALLFAAFHLNPYQFLSAFLAGILLGWLFVKTQSLWPPIIAHAIFNAQGWVAINIEGVTIPGYTVDVSELENVAFQPLWFDLVGVVLAAIGLVGLIRLFRPARPLPASSGAV